MGAHPATVSAGKMRPSNGAGRLERVEDKREWGGADRMVDASPTALGQ